ncbi:hypothetical protein K435DRAFT_861757 [Dendrothele bispora CBS 962.96]|uniref:Uncharacterized protein n=1 Tax=Dendrothele bispora (strain CBS 962.96) TaxID=1314807 RepID=A0A4S8LUU2_DENBC|nr:hypothetical protein K435DRAFT_861757 [Dendrothele bispora CBS 962.96]
MPKITKYSTDSIDQATRRIHATGVLQKEDSGDDGAQPVVTGMLPTTSSRGDKDPKGDNNEGNQTTNDRSQGEIEGTDRLREGKSLDTRDSPKDGSSDEAVHAGSSHGETASGTDIAG